MKNIIVIISCLTLFTSCKTREILSKSMINSYNLNQSNLIGTEVFVTDPIRMVYDTLVQSTSNNKGFIDVQQIRTVDKVTVKLQSKGIIQSVDNVLNQRMVVGVAFEDRTEPIYFLMTKFGVFQLFLDENGKVPYGDHNYTLTSTQIPQLEVIVRKNKNVSQTKIVMDGY